MALIKCKMCGGDLVLDPGQSIAECEYCGSRQTVPAADNEKKLVQFERAERLRRNCEFDKASGLYESIIADFRQEAEAYWGLVLCKYGIEYVDDPATGKKIPTCHRSSFESVMDDGNLELALEYADVVARRVYREEAKQIEELRKGIITVSSREEPYDIFICYKETDSSGNRTLDSVLAQDIYDALTEKGYRVFFSRITLEEKLGQEYEPYIFAALNSAKIMLAVGTDYEHYNAVWVKNEWSRFLKLMAADKSKHLIPCFKDIDAYDIPREFNKLQGQDMGKLGAMQDLLRGIEKLMPKAKAEPERKSKPQETVQYDKVTTLMKRAAISLEDWDWKKADQCYEEVLNMDPECAEAYLGKALIQERCSSLSALVQKRIKLLEDPQKNAEKLEYRFTGDPVARIVQEYARPGLLEEAGIRSFYQKQVKDLQLEYTSSVKACKTQKAEEERWWQEHKLLYRAEKYAGEALREQLRKEKAELMAMLDRHVLQAQEAEHRSLEKIREEHLQILDQTEAVAKQILRTQEQQREANYQKWVHQAKEQQSSQTYLVLAKSFRSLGGYRDSRELEKHCIIRAEELEKKDTGKSEKNKEQGNQQSNIYQNYTFNQHQTAHKRTIAPSASGNLKSLLLVFATIATCLLLFLEIRKPGSSDAGSRPIEVSTTSITTEIWDDTQAIYVWSTVNYEYVSADSEITIVHLVNSNTPSTIIIPDEIDGYPVTAIGDYAFANFSKLNTITIPESVLKIGKGAFSGCSGLAQITISSDCVVADDALPEGCTILYYDSSSNSQNTQAQQFQFEYSLNDKGVTITGYQGDIPTELVIPSTIDGFSVTEIGEHVFQYCNSLKSVIIPDGVTVIDDRAFSYCSELTSVSIPNSVTQINFDAFYECKLLSDINIPPSVTYIGSSAFYRCEGITSVSLPENAWIGSGAFEYCSNLSDVLIPDSIAHIDGEAFDGTPWLNSKTEEFVIVGDGVLLKYNGTNSWPTIPSSVKMISSAFQNCDFLGGITIPYGVTYIGDDAFEGCSALSSVSIPNSVKTIGNDAFSGCRSLTSVIIPEGVEHLFARVFYNCANLSYVSIPRSVVYIGPDAFTAGPYSDDFPPQITSVTISRECQVSNDAFPDGCVINYY